MSDLCRSHLVRHGALLFEPGLVLLKRLLSTLIEVGALVVFGMSVLAKGKQCVYVYKVATYCSTKLRRAVGTLSDKAKSRTTAAVSVLAALFSGHCK